MDVSMFHQQHDMKMIAERLIPYAPRESARTRLWAIAREYDEKLSNLLSLLKGKKLSCPIHKSSADVIITGNGRNGSKKFLCKREHADEDLFRNSKNKTFRFNTYTSYEALKVYQDFLVEAMSILSMCGGTYEGIAKYLNISKYAVELGVGAFADYIQELKGKRIINVEEEWVLVFTDFSTTRVSRAASIIMAKVGDQVAYQISCSVNYMTAWNFISNLKRTLVVKPNAKIIIVTDGEVSWVSPIQRFYPDAIHIRQFHQRNLLGIIYCHYKYDEKNFTCRLPWDCVLSHGLCSEKTKSMRVWRKNHYLAKEPKNDEKKTTQLFRGVILWEGIVFYPRGERQKSHRKTSATPTGAIIQPMIACNEIDDDANQSTLAAEGSPHTENCDTFYIAPSSVVPAKRVFKGSLTEALSIPPVKYIHSILLMTFSGLYITTNNAECLFGVKLALRYHRTVKTGNKLTTVILFARTVLKSKSRDEIKDFFRKEVFTFPRLEKTVVARNHLSSLEKQKKERVRSLIEQSCKNALPVIIYYQDGKGRRTSRMIEPTEIVRDSYTGQEKVEAYCHLRQEMRTFIMDRIIDALPDEHSIIVLP